MQVTPSQLRSNIYKLLDTILETGQPLEIMRHNQLLRIEPVEHVDKLSRLKKRKLINGDSEDIVSMDWSKEWKPIL